VFSPDSAAPTPLARGPQPSFEPPKICDLHQSSSASPLPHVRSFPRALSSTSESDFALWHLPFSGIIPIVRNTRSALYADQDHSGSPRSLSASISERAVLTDPAAVFGHLAICGAPTGASQPLRCCRPAVKYLTRLNRFTFVTARASLCLRLIRFVTSSDPRLDSR